MAYWQQLEGEVDDELTKDVASLRAILSESVPPSYPVAEREREESSSRSAVSELQICLDKNIALQELLTEKLTVLELALAENKHKLFEVERLGKMRRSVQKGIVTIWRKRKNDYFKDSRGQAPPSLSVVHKSLDQLGTAVYCAGLSWMCKKKEKSDVKLTEAVRRQIIDTLSQPLQASLMRATDRDEKMLLRRHIQDISKQTISQLVKEDVTINWPLLAYEEFNNSHTAADCELRWIGHTHPGINKGAWKKQEDKELMKIARSHNFFDWSSIASELGTGRTGFMCLQRYQQSLNPNTFTKVFSDEDDARLKEAIKIYGESRWSLVSAHVEGKTPPQCMQRWVNSLSPGIKKGRWTQKEDEVLREAVRKCGVGNWTNVATFVSGRTKSQVRERWVNHLDEKVSKTQWTKEEDRKLMEICQRHSSGPIPWATVAKEMVTRTDAMCLQRWLTIGDTSAIFSRFSKSCKQRETVMTSSLGKKRSKHTFREDDIEEMVDEATKEKLKMYGEKLTKRKRPRPRQIQQEDTSSVESGGVATGAQYAFPQGRFIVLSKKFFLFFVSNILFIIIILTNYATRYYSLLSSH